MNKKAPKKNEKLRELLIILAVLGGVTLILVSVMLIPSCKRYFREKDPAAHSGTYGEKDEVVFVDESTGIGYVRCPAGIGANTLDYVYLKLGDSVKLYKIDFEDPKMYISEAKNADFGSYVYRAENVEPLTLESFVPCAATIHRNGFETGRFYAPELAEENSSLEDGTKYIDAITSAFTGESAELTGPITDENTFEIRLLSREHQGLYYTVTFFTDENGVAYLEDSVTGKTVTAPDIIKIRMIG